jgi:hypothetical protein
MADTTPPSSQLREADFGGSQVVSGEISSGKIDSVQIIMCWRETRGRRYLSINDIDINEEMQGRYLELKNN